MALPAAVRQPNAQQISNAYYAGQHNAAFYTGNGSHQIVYDLELNAVHLSAGNGEDNAFAILPKPPPVVVNRLVPSEVNQPISKPLIRSKRCWVILLLIVALIIIIVGVVAGVVFHEIHSG